MFVSLISDIKVLNQVFGDNIFAFALLLAQTESNNTCNHIYSDLWSKNLRSFALSNLNSKNLNPVGLH